MTFKSTQSSSSFWCVHLWHLFCFALTECYVAFACLLVESSTANWTFHWTACLVYCCFLLGCQLLSFSLLKSCSECCTLLLPFRYFFLFGFCIFHFFLLDWWRRRGHLEVLYISLPMSSWIESLSLGLKHFFTYFFMFYNGLSTKLSAASSWALNHNQLFFLFCVHWFLLYFLILARRWVFRIFLGHLPLKDCHKILVWVERYFFIRI